MRWHLIATVGPGDQFSPGISEKEARILIPFDHPTSPWRLGNDTEQVLLEKVGVNVHPVARDLLRIAVAVYCADLRIPRERTDDRWTREMTLYMPVSDPELWGHSKAALVELLNFLSGDYWDVQFRRGEPVPEAVDLKPAAFDCACLFSGGLDSLVGVIDLLASGKRVALVSHHGLGDGTKSIQTRVMACLKKHFGDTMVHVPFYVHPEKGNTEEGENTMRARSILFMAMGVATATAGGEAPVLTVAENGLISLNVPLTHARIGSSSTRTTHPHYMALFRALLKGLNINVELRLPYRHKTKGEMLREVAHRPSLVEATPLTMSCSHPTVGRYAGKTPGNHCGYCVPCLIRFASLQAADMTDRAPNYDIFQDPPADSTKRASDIRAFGIGIERLRLSDPRTDIFSVLKSGPIPAEEARSFAAVFRRGMLEVASYLGREDS